MDAQFFSLLPAASQAMVREVEAAIHSEIVVRPRADGDPDPGSGMLDLCICDMVDGVTTVTIVTADMAPTRGYLIHEVAHAHRNLVQEVLQLEAIDGADAYEQEIALAIDNDIEHSSILPIEFALAPEARGDWEAHYGSVLDELDCRLPVFPRLPPVLQQRTSGDYLRHWLFASTLLPGWSRLSGLWGIIEGNGWSDAATALVHAFQAAPTKLDRVLVLLQHLGLNRERFALRQFRPAQGVVTTYRFE